MPQTSDVSLFAYWPKNVKLTELKKLHPDLPKPPEMVTSIKKWAR